MQRLAIGEHDLQQTTGWPAIFNRLHSDRHFVARLERSLAPPSVNHVGRIARLRNPMRDIAAFILDVITQEAVRIGPKPSRESGGGERRIEIGESDRVVIREVLRMEECA
jgi:hypothetical protein